MTKKEALIKALELDEEEAEEVEEIDKLYFETPEGEYLVTTEEQATNLAYDNLSNVISEMGITAFSENFQQTIIDNFLDKEWFKDFWMEADYSYAEDIQDVSAENDEEFDNRLEEEMAEMGVDNIDDFVEKRIEEREEDGGLVQEYIMNFGEEFLTENINNYHDLLDIEGIIQEVIDIDGLGSILSSYDGEMLEEGDYFIFRTN